MAKILWYDNEGNAVERELQAGPNRVGRDPSNDIRLDHPSVSGFHCEIINEPDRIRVRDLDSTNGTLVNDFPIQEAEIKPGQSLQVGDIVLELRSPSSVKVSGQPSPPDQASPAAVPPVAEDEVRCERCQKNMPLTDAHQRRVGNAVLYFCPTCGTRCATHSPPAARVKPSRPVEKSFSKYLVDAFAYPFRGKGLVILISGTLFFILMDWFLSCLYIIAFAYFYNFLKDIIVTSAQGEDELPPWPEFTDIITDIVTPCFQFLGMVLICAGPGLAWLIYGPEVGKLPIAFALFLLGAFYFPMALVGVAMFDSLSAMNPLLILNSIMKIASHYLVVFFLLLVLLTVKYAGTIGGNLIRASSDDLGTRIFLFFALGVVSEFAALYLFIVMTRALGVMYYVNRKRLGWV